MLSAGTRVGPYEIVSWLGAGGMGEVYRARDINLHREVALKTLPDELARQPERLARLRQEARILASLNHPGIATLHGLEESDGGLPVLVMELVEGETLADRLQRGRLKPHEALTIAREIARRLEAAHEKGVLHRDLKPSNIRLLPDCRVKLLDFGLARAVREAVLDSGLDTETSPRSEPGAVLGTAPYMSPEQARGQEVDRRADVWAFGCVLFEMLAGKRAFEGATFSDTVAAVLEHEPDWPALPQGTPSAALRLLRRCVQKEKDKRLHDVADARLEVEELLAGPTSTEHHLPVPRRRSLWAALVILVLLLGGFVSWLIRRATPVSRDVVRFSVEWSSGAPVVSPTGVRLVDVTPSGLIVRDLDKQEGRLLQGTAGAFKPPFFSPDGTWLGFNGGAGTLKKISLTGGAPLTVCKGLGDPNGATWGPDDTIVFTPSASSGLWLVPASGGEPRELTRPDRARGEKSHRWPNYLPGGEAVLFTVGTIRLTNWDDARIDVLVLRTGERRTVLEGGTSATYVKSGHLVYRRGASILAAPFDLGRLEVTGFPVAVVDDVGSNFSNDGRGLFTVAETGLLAYLPHTRTAARLVRVDRAGKAQPLSPFVPQALREPRLSPDGRVVSVGRRAPNNQVWLFDIERVAFSQLTFEWDNTSPVWMPDGESMIVSSTPGFTLHRVRVDGSARPEPLAGAGASQFPGSVTPDGKFLLFRATGTDTKEDIWMLPLAPPGEPRVFLQTPAYEGDSAISPDGRLVAYVSDESGQMEVYVRSFPDGGGKVQVSAGGGFDPVWARSGKELFYRVELEGLDHAVIDQQQRMMVVDVSPGKPLRLSRARGLFEDSYEVSGTAPIYDVFPDGRHFVMIEVDREASRVTHLNVVMNWFEELKRLVPPK